MKQSTVLDLALARVEAVRISGTNAERDEASRLAKEARELMEAAGRALARLAVGRSGNAAGAAGWRPPAHSAGSGGCLPLVPGFDNHGMKSLSTIAPGVISAARFLLALVLRRPSPASDDSGAVWFAVAPLSVHNVRRVVLHTWDTASLGLVVRGSLCFLSREQYAIDSR